MHKLFSRNGDSGKYEKLKKQGEEALARNDFKKAYALFTEALELSPENPEAHKNLGNVQLRTSNLEEAIKLYIQAAQIDPNYYIAYHNLGIAYKKKENYHEAIRNFQKALAIEPEYSSSYNSLAHCLKNIKLFDEAEKNYLKALTLEPDFIEASIGLADLYLETSKINEADAIVRPLIDKGIQNFYIYRLLARILIFKRHYSDALIALQQALILEPESDEILLLLGKLQYKMGHLEEASEYMEKAISINPSIDYDSLMIAGSIWDQLECFEKALFYYQKALELMPDSADVCYRIAFEYHRIRDYQNALEYYEKAATSPIHNENINVAAIYYFKAVIFLEMGLITQAKESINKCLAADKNDSDAQDLQQKIDALLNE